MNATQLFLERHQPLHDELVPLLLEPLSADQLRAPAHSELNPIAWLLWHMARAEDIGVNRFVADRRQVFDEGGWARRMNVERRDVGTSMPAEEVSDLAREIDLEELESYRKAIALRTVQVVDELNPAALDERVDEAGVEHVLFDEEAVGQKAASLLPEYVGQTKGWCLNHFGLTHNFYHLGQAFAARKILGVSGAW